MTIDPQQLERHFGDLVDLPPSQREQALQKLATEAPALAARLAVLLDAHRRDDGAFDALDSRLLQAVGGFDAAALLGREIDGWRLTDVLGQGGMGVVFAAERDDGGIRQQAALKLLAVPLFDPRAGERFVREARLLARLDHPGICRLRGWGRTPEHWPYLVLDLIRGQPLDAFAATTRPLRERLALMVQVADAVAAAHRQLVAHLDLKPANVLVVDGTRPVLLDFGVARALNADDTHDATMTRWLTPDYASPEQLRGEPATAAADIYALGVLLYQLATGRRPFELTGLTITDALDRVARGAPAPSRLVARLSGDLDAICACAMHVDPARRYISADAFADDLRALLASRPVKARPDSLGYRLRKALQRRPVALPASLLAGACIVGLAVMLALQAVDLRMQRDRAEHHAQRARAATGLLLGSIRAANPLVREGGELTVSQLLDATATRISDELADDDVLHGETLIHLGDAQRALAQYAQSIPLYAQARTLLADADPDDPTLVDLRMRAVVGQVEALRAIEKVDEAIALAEAGFDEIPVAGHWELALVLARAQLSQGRRDAAEPLLLRALDGIPEKEATSRARARNDLGFIHQSRGEHARALEWFDLARADLPDTPSDRMLLANILGNASFSNVKLGHHELALEQIEQAIQMRIATYGENHPATVVAMLDRVYVLDTVGRFDEAAAVARRAIAAETALGDGRTRRMERLQNMLGTVLRKGGDATAALEPLRASLDLAQALYPATQPMLGSAHSAYASALADTGDAAACADHARRARDIYEQASPGSRGAAIAAANLSDCQRSLGHSDEALDWAGKALDEMRALPDATQDLATHVGRIHAAALHASGRHADALAAALAVKAAVAESTDAPDKVEIERLDGLIADIRAALEPADAPRR